MYQGKRVKHNKKKSVTLLASLALVLSVAVVGSVAFLVASDDAVTNTFVPTEVTSKVLEDEFTANSTSKTNARIQNTGDVNAYIRAAIVMNWVDDAGNILGQPVREGDYTISIPNDTGWKKHTDGYYYYTSAVVPNGETGKLIESCAPVADKTPNDHHLSVEILCSAIQAEGQDSSGQKPVQIAWGIDPETLKNQQGG